MGQVIVTIDKTGEIHMDYQGYAGMDCHLAEQNIKERIKRLQLQTIGEQDKEFFEDRLHETA